MSLFFDGGRISMILVIIHCYLATGLAGCAAHLASQTPSRADLIPSTWYTVYFSVQGTERQSAYHSGPENSLVEAIDRSRLSVEMAVDNLNLWVIRDALIDAHRRGVVIRVVVDSDNLKNAEIQDLVEAGIPVSGDGRNGYMHDKFVIIDRAETWTGSMNFTLDGIYGSANNLIRVRSLQLAQVYLSEFEEMFVEGTFGQGSDRDLDNPFVLIDGSLLEAYFAPEDEVAERLKGLIQAAQESIHFLAYAFTDDELAAALVEASNRGLEVGGVMDAAQARSNIASDYEFFVENGLDVRLDDRPGKMHHKVLIIDKAIVVTGSYNFSNNARTRNDENTLIIHDKEVAEVYLGEFQRILAGLP